MIRQLLGDVTFSATVGMVGQLTLRVNCIDSRFLPEKMREDERKNKMHELKGVYRITNWPDTTDVSRKSRCQYSVKLKNKGINKADPQGYAPEGIS